jgi:CheY-like chemotaxis protein
MARLLVVEDDTDIRELVLARLRSVGHRAVGVGNADAALALVEERGAPELFLLDIGLPDIDGYTLLERLRARLDCVSVPAIFLSARVQPQDIERGRAMGAMYLTKPFVANALFSAVEKGLASLTPATQEW